MIDIENTLEERLEKCVNCRFKDHIELKFFIGCESLDYNSNEEIDANIDYSLTGTFGQATKEGMYYDFDIYYAKTRAGEMYITEVTTRFE